jgi:ribosomal protein S18 acetylase RimI-like enzyme
MIFLQPVSPQTASAFKEVRLRALQDSPLAFSSTYTRESELPQEEWIARSQRWDGEGSVLYLAFDDLHPLHACGMVACYGEQNSGRLRGHVISMWVDPAYRRAGVGRMLIDALKTWASSRGMHELKLMVTSVNQPAIDFYIRMGFLMSGMTGPYPNDAAVIEHEMLLPLGP